MRSLLRVEFRIEKSFKYLFKRFDKNKYKKKYLFRSIAKILKSLRGEISSENKFNQ